ncbi:MAG: aspartate kinase [Chloroflexi bacterium]|nr:aspartate kinase [Chloroflexota bacterium]
MATYVMKFGGTSVGSVEAILSAAKIVQNYSDLGNQMVVVVSAMRGVTDDLIHSAEAAAAGDETTYKSLIDKLRDQHHQVLAELQLKEQERVQLLMVIDQHIDELNSYCRSIHVLGEVTLRGMDTITSLGERLNARIVSAALRTLGMNSQAVNATKLIITDETFQNAIPLMDITRQQLGERLIPLLKSGIVPVVTGFIGATKNGIITTLGRGGSDYTAAILGAGIDADAVWTWTDVDGVMTADPRIVSGAQVIPALSFNEISELAYFGAKVLHPKTIRPIIERDIPLWVKNTFNPSCPGTKISKSPGATKGNVTAISTVSNLSMITVEGRGMLGVPGIAARTFAAVARTGASVLMISQASSEQSISFVIPATSTLEVIQSIEEEMSRELERRDIDRIWAQDSVTILTVVGASIRTTPGVAARIFSALGGAQINVIAIAQGSSEYSISLVVSEKDANEAMRRIHDEVILNEA